MLKHRIIKIDCLDLPKIGLCLLMAFSQPLMGASRSKKIPKSEQAPIHDENSFPSFSSNELLKKSQISYRAEGGFSVVESYSVIISCVDGKITALSTIHDPHLYGEKSTLRRVQNLDAETYLNLWDSLKRLKYFQKEDAPPAKREIRDEFTVTFNLNMGDWKHSFSVDGCSRPEASSYFALRNLIDQTSQMTLLWNEYRDITKN